MKATTQTSQMQSAQRSSLMLDNDSMPTPPKESTPTGEFLKVGTPIYDLKVSEETMQSLRALRPMKP